MRPASRRPPVRRAMRMESWCAMGRPCSSSSAWAATPTAKKNASSVATRRAPSVRGASVAPMTTYERCHAVYGGWSIVHQSRQPPGARRRTRGVPRQLDFSGPHHEPAPETHRARTDVDEPCVLPRSDGPRHRVAAVVRRDVGSEEASDPTPLATARDVARNRQHAARVQPPPEPPEPVRRDRELQACDRRARLEDACELAQRRGGIGDVAQQIGERQRVERVVGKRKPFGLPDDEPHAARRSGCARRVRGRVAASPR